MEYARRLSMRNNLTMQYPSSPGVIRYPVEEIFWEVPLAKYRSPSFTSGLVFASPFADLEFSNPDAKFKWNKWDGLKNRMSYEGKYGFTKEGYPQNPMGRTGIRGRGVLLNWGVNHHVTCLITRKTIELVQEGEGGCQSLKFECCREFLAVLRKEDNEWEIPTGAVQPGEGILAAQKRVILEVLFNSKNLTKCKFMRLNQSLSSLLLGMVQRSVYHGYVDDNRNTDNAWVETTVFNVDLTAEQCKMFDQVRAGSEFEEIKWMEIPDDPSSLKLHAGQTLYLHSYLRSLTARDVNDEEDEDESEVNEDKNEERIEDEAGEK